jgi:hypothetical protein
MATNNQPASPDARTTSLAEMLTITVFEVNGHSLVTGLLWEKLDKPRSFMSEARARGKAYGMDIVAIRDTTTVTQAGFAPKNRGAYKGMYSFAHVMADILGDNCLAVFALPDERYALFAILDGGIVPGSDQVGDRETIESKQNELRNLVGGTSHRWNRLIAPEGFSLSDETLALEDIITQRVLKRSQQLKQLTFGLSRSELIKVGAAAALVVVIAGTAMYLVHRHRAAVLLEQQMRAQQDAINAAKELAAQASTAQQVTTLPHPWAAVAPVDATLAACLPKLRQFPLSLGGWVLDNAKCQSAGTFGAMYKRMGTQTVEDFKAAVMERYHAPAAILDGGDTGGVGGSYAAAPGTEDILPTDQDAKDLFATQFQALDITAPLTLVPVTPPAPGQKNPPPMPDWKTYTFTIKTELTPVAVFAGVPRAGLRITEVAEAFDANAAKLTWTFTGDQYAR